MEVLCARLATESEPATWGEAADQAQKGIDFIEKNEPPEELRDIFEANVAVSRLTVRFAEEKGRSLSYDEETRTEFYNEDPERNEVFNTFGRALGALDDAVLEIVEAGC